MTLDELLDRIERDLPDNWQISMDFYGGGCFDFSLFDSDGVQCGYQEMRQCETLKEFIELAISIARGQA